jgi:hypothetical protein
MKSDHETCGWVRGRNPGWTRLVRFWIVLVWLFPSVVAFVSNRNGSGQSRRWEIVTERGIPVWLAAEGFSSSNTFAELNAVRASFDQWESVPGTILKFGEPELVFDRSDLNPNDGTNLVFWANHSLLINGGRDSLLGTLSLTFPRVDAANRLLEADIVLNGVQFRWFTDFEKVASPDQFIESSMLHEIGHFIGLDHSPAGGATLFARGTTGVNSQAGLSPDDMEAVRWLYPTEETLRLTGAIGGRILRNEEPVHGAVVLAETSAGSLVAATLSLEDGSYELPALFPEVYTLRVTSLDPVSNGSLERLLSGADISRTFLSARVGLAPAVREGVQVEPSATNRVEIHLSSVPSDFRITRIQPPMQPGAPRSAINAPVAIRPGTGVMNLGVYTTTPLASSVRLVIPGDGLELGPTRTIPDAFPGSNPPLHLAYTTLAVTADATPGLRSFVLENEAELAYANGFLEILPPQFDFNFDQLEDRFQRAYFPLFTSSDAAPEADPDGDRMNNRGEAIAGTDPGDPASVLRVEQVRLTPEGTEVTWQSEAGKTYRVERTSGVGGSRWSRVGGLIVGTGSRVTLMDRTARATIEFYRIQVSAE